MRSGYIQRARHDNGAPVARGGITSAQNSGCDDYEIEIGNNCHFSISMFAFCCMKDEILDFVRSADNGGNALAGLVLKKLGEVEDFYHKDYDNRSNRN